MTNALANTIVLDGFLGPMEEKLTASGSALKPGMLVFKTSADEWNVHAVSGGVGIPWLLHEDRYQYDSSDSGGVTLAYTAATPAFAEAVQPGAKRYVLLKASENVAVGDYLISGGDGTFIKTTGTPARTFCQADEASNTGTAQLIKARFL